MLSWSNLNGTTNSVDPVYLGTDYFNISSLTKISFLIYNISSYLGWFLYYALNSSIGILCLSNLITI